jgi:DNA primase small subunit
MPHALSPEQAVDSSPADARLPDAAADSQDATMSDAPNEASQSSGKGLEDMFDDDDDSGDEFSSSAATREADSSQVKPQSAPKGNFSEPETLRQFYQRLCPFRHLFQWLNHSATPQPDFQNREFSFWLPGNTVIRYLSFPSADLLRKQCVQMAPERFEIGPQYSINPKDRKTLKKASAFKPVMKELVFDIDMTDYDSIRTCCSGAKICIKCWQFIVMAIKVVDKALREDFGFQHIMWVYSGRRGAHAWVSDKRAREMDDTKRRAVANYMEALRGNENGRRNAFRRPLHPHIERSLKILTPYFQTDVLAEQDPWQSNEQAEKLLNLLPDKSLTDALKKKWESAPADRSSAQKWADIDAVAEAGNLSTLSTKQLVETKQDIRLEYTYPRLDAEVSKKLNHLLKSPFVVHPGTGRVCVPIDMRTVEDFDPFTVPTVTQLLGEIDDWEKKKGADMSDEEKAKVQDWQKTSLKPYIEYFRGHVASLIKEEGKGKRERDEDGMEF